MVQHKSKIPSGFINGSVIEDYIAACQCGGKFGKSHSPRCPDCNEPLDIKSLLDLSDNEITKRDSGGYYVVGYDCELEWKPPKP